MSRKRRECLRPPGLHVASHFIAERDRVDAAEIRGHEG